MKHQMPFDTCLVRMPSAIRARSWQPLHLTMLLSGSMLISACAGISPNPTPGSNRSADASSFTRPAAVSPIDRTIVANIVGFSKQIFSPISTTLQFRNDPQDPLLGHFISEFARAGYGIQRVSADQGSNYFSYNRESGVNDEGVTQISFDTTIGAVNIGRDYIVPRTNMVSPASPVRLAGTRVPVSVDDKATGRFLIDDNPDNAAVVYAASLNLNEQAPPVISLLTEDLVDRVVSQETQSTSVQALNSSRLEVNNLFFADQSNFSTILNDFDQVDRQIVVFGNDSMILGDTNKLLIEQLVQERLEPDDLISLVGCSNGPTTLDIGNEGLALGRAKRVTESLLSQGVARERILDEGCWAPVSAGESFPSRGVVLEVWRKTA